MSAGGKITTLKAAAKDLVQQLKQNAISQDQVRIAVVPFAQYVNVGLSRRNEPWISVSADWTETIPRSCYTRTPVTSATNCVTTTHTGQSCNDGVCTPRTYTRRTCDYTYGAPQQVCVGPRTVNHVWRGCVGSRGAPRYKTDDSYNVEKVPGLLDTSCSTEMLPLIGIQGQIISKINSLSPSGETYIPSGLIWGWRALSPGAPFSESALGGADPVEQALVLMTDGFNTKSRNGSKHNGSNTNDANTTTSDICTNIKAVSSGIKVCTIAYSVTDPAIKAILQNCASKPEYYFDAGSNAQLTAAFEQIARSLTQIRLTR